MSFSLKSLILSSFAALLLSVPAFSQTTGIEGVVKDQDGKTVQGAVVTFERTDIKGHYTVKSDKKGHYGHYGLPMGTFTVTVAIDGQVRDTATNFRTTPGDPKTLNFDLKQTAAQQQALAKAAELDPPGAGKYYYNLGALLVNSGQNDAAQDEFKKAIDSDPNYADAYLQYGMGLAAKATTDATGKVIPAPGTVESLQKYLELKPDGANAQQAKEMIAALGGAVSTSFQNPNASKGKAAPPKKK